MFWAYGYVVGPLLAAMVVVGALQLLTSWRPAPATTGPLTDPSSILRRLRN
jgi:hypothetical protein